MNFVNALNALRITVWIAIGVLFVFRVASRYLATKVSGQSPLQSFVNAANTVKPNVWAMAIVAGGVVLSCCGKGDGSSLVAGGFALMQREAAASPNVPSAPSQS